MLLSKRYPANNAELGKKSDDRPRQGAMTGTSIRTWRGPRRKRILLAIFICALLYSLIKYLPTDLTLASKHVDSNSQPPPPSSPQGPPPRLSKSVTEHYYDGQIKFYNLASTLGYGMGSLQHSRNVLFAASSLKSASRILPLACEM